MRLLKVSSENDLSLTKDLIGDDEVPPFCILSHCWEDGHEVTFNDFNGNQGRDKSGYQKIQFCAQQAKRDGFEYFWVDTCCINKADAVELQDAINSMFRFYQNAAMCYVYMSDVSIGKRKADCQCLEYTWEPGFRESRWFTRGWTLQELLAPSDVKFFSKEGHYLGSKRSLEHLISDVTGIAKSALRVTPLKEIDIETRLSWTKNRRTTRKEDKAYSLLGIFGVYMPLIYGEGESNAFRRLREEIDKDELMQRSTTMRANTTQDKSGSSASSRFTPQEIECLQSLAFPEQEQRYKRIVTAKNTCQWLFEDPVYQSWIRKSRGILWIKGNPGTGKSVLMKSACAEMYRRQSGELVFSFFIHGQGTDLQKTPLGVYRALLNSMSKYFPEHLSQLTKLFSDREERYGSFTANRWKWQEEDLQDVLSSVLTKGSMHRQIIIYIDALDECGEENAKHLLNYFKEITEDIGCEGFKLKVCVSSRHYPIIGVDNIPNITVETRNHNDICLVIAKTLREIEPEWRRQELQKAILAGVKGGFQWAILVAARIVDKYMTGWRLDKLHAVIASMPPALDKLYGNILGELSWSEEQQILKLFQWVLFAARPLSSQELRDALATDMNMTNTTVSQLRRHDSWIEPLTHFERHVKHLSRGLVEFRTREVYEEYEPGGEASDREALFIHQSVADYLLEKFCTRVTRYQQVAKSFTGAGHLELSRSCLKYLALEEIDEAAGLPRRSLSARFPLLPYATRFIFEHIRKLEEQGHQQPDLLDLFQWNVEKDSLGTVAHLWATFDPDNNHTPVGWPFLESTKLHFLVALGSKSCLEIFLADKNVEVSRKDSNGCTPLLLAAMEDRQDMALMLLLRTSNEAVDVQDEDGRTTLSWAAENGCLTLVQRLLETGTVQVNLKDASRSTALSWAARKGRDMIVSQLIEAPGILLDQEDDFGLTPLSWAVSNGHTRTIELLLKTKRVDTLRKCNSGRTILSYAVEKNYEAIFRLLLDDEALIDLEDEDKRTPLSWAASKGLKVLMKVLLDTKRVDLDHVDSSGRTPLFHAIQNTHSAVVKLLLDTNQVNVNLVDYEGRTPLLVAVYQTRYGGAKSGPNQLQGPGSIERESKAILTSLLKTGKINTSYVDGKGRTALSYASENGDSVVLETLLGTTKPDQVDVKDHHGLTPLAWAAQQGHTTAVRLLLNTGQVSPNINDRSSGQTPLHRAAARGHMGVLKLLLELSAVDPAIADDHGRTALGLAASKGHEQVVKLLLSTGRVHVDPADTLGRTPLSYAVEHAHLPVIKRLLDTGRVNVDHMDHSKQTPLSRAIGCGHIHVAQLLLKEGKIDVNKKDMDGRTQLLRATRQGQERIVKLLLYDGKADANICDKDQWTPLSWAAWRGQEPIVKLLLDTGKVEIDSNAGIFGQTPLLRAAKSGHEGAVQLLLETGKVNVNARDRNGMTPLSWASQEDHYGVVRLLLSTGEADVKVKDNDGLTALLRAAREACEITIILLLEADQDGLNATDKDGLTPLMRAAQKGREQIVKLFIGNDKVQLNARDKSGWTSLTWAVFKGHEGVVRLLLNTGRVNESLDILYAKMFSRRSIIKLFLDSGKVDFNKRTYLGEALFLRLVKQGRANMVALLLDTEKMNITLKTMSVGTSVPWVASLHSGVDVSVKLRLDTGNVEIEPRDSASMKDSVAIMVLMTHRADVRIVDREGHTLLHQGAYTGRPGFELRLEVGRRKVADVNIPLSLIGQTPFTTAIAVGDTTLVADMLRTGMVFLDSVDKDGYTPLMYAVQQDRVDIVEMLLDTEKIDLDKKYAIYCSVNIDRIAPSFTGTALEYAVSLQRPRMVEVVGRHSKAWRDRLVAGP